MKKNNKTYKLLYTCINEENKYAVAKKEAKKW